MRFVLELKEKTYIIGHTQVPWEVIMQSNVLKRPLPNKDPPVNIDQCFRKVQ